jgi:hypothetical protein
LGDVHRGAGRKPVSDAAPDPFYSPHFTHRVEPYRIREE